MSGFAHCHPILVHMLWGDFALCSHWYEILPCGSDGKDSACEVGDLGSIPGLGRSSGKGSSFSIIFYVVLYKILQTRLQQYMNHELPDVQAGFRKSRGTRDQIVSICSIMEKAREFQKNIYFCFIDYAKAFDCADHEKLWKILKEMGIPDHLTWLLRNLYADQEATVRTGHGTTDWFQIGKGVR